MVLKPPPFDLHICAVQILERGVPPVLDTATISQFPARRASYCAIVVLFHPTRPLDRKLPR